MSDASHDISRVELPDTVPIFPLTGALLLPRGRLPLNVFEPRYLQLVRDVLGGQRLIGMVQPTEHEDRVKVPNLYTVGCLGRIGSFSEAEEGRYLITLTGVWRYRIAEELPSETLYRHVRTSYDPFPDDDRAKGSVTRERLMEALLAYLTVKAIEIDWKTVEDLEDDELVTALAMACPFEPEEKQALLEAQDLSERGRALTSLLEMGALELSGAADTTRQ